MKTRWTIVLTLVALLLGAFIGWSQRTQLADAEILQLSAVHQVEIASLCTGTISVIDDRDRVHRVLHQRLESAIDQLYRLPDDATQFGPGLPNLKEGLARSIAYLRESDSRYAAWAEEVAGRGQ